MLPLKVLSSDIALIPANGFAKARLERRFALLQVVKDRRAKPRNCSRTNRYPSLMPTITRPRAMRTVDMRMTLLRFDGARNECEMTVRASSA